MLRKRRSFTLVELLVTVSVMSIAVSAAVGAYWFALVVTARTASLAAVVSNASGALEAMRETLEAAHECSVTKLPNGSTAIVCSVPSDTAYGQPAPFRIDTFGVARYAAGDLYAFYCSDTSGSITSSGNVLWRARAPAGSMVFTPDVAWSLYYDTGTARYSVTIDDAGTSADRGLGIVRVTLRFSGPVRATSISARETHEITRTVTRTFYYRYTRK